MKLKIDVFVKLAPPLGNSDTLESITMPSDDLGLFSSSKFRFFICAYGSFQLAQMMTYILAIGGPLLEGLHNKQVHDKINRKINRRGQCIWFSSSCASSSYSFAWRSLRCFPHWLLPSISPVSWPSRLQCCEVSSSSSSPPYRQLS